MPKEGGVAIYLPWYCDVYTELISEHILAYSLELSQKEGFVNGKVELFIIFTFILQIVGQKFVVTLRILSRFVVLL